MRTAALLAVLLSAGCSAAPTGTVAIQTMPDLPVCAAARIGGVLVADQHYGLAFQGDGGVVRVVWPYGYSARRGSDGAVVLLDPDGDFVAQEGDRVEASGAYNEAGTPLAQCDLRRVDSLPGG